VKGIRLVLVATVALCVLCTGIAFAQQEGSDSSAQGTVASSSLAEIPAPSASELAEAEREAREHSEWLSSPKAREQREASDRAYTSLTVGEAQDLLVEAFPRQLETLNSDPARVISNLEVEKPLGTYGALVSDEDGESAILNSSVPVQSDLGGEGKEPVDLALEQSGNSFVPRNPLTKIEFPDSAEEPIQLESGVEVDLPASDDHGAVSLGAMNLFYPETETATDTLVSPKAKGVEVFEQLRSPESPERFSFALSLPKEATLRPNETGGAEIIGSTGGALGEVPPPSATDAQGAAVPVSMTVQGDSLILEVSHRSGEVAYPILLDPEYVTATTSFGEWSASLNSGYEYYLNNNWSSLDAISRGHYFYPAYTHGQWAYGAYGQTAYIAAATFSPVDYIVHSCYTYEPHGYIGLYNPGSGGYDALGVWATWSSEGPYETGWRGNSGTRDAIIGIGTGSNVEINCAHELYVGGYSIQEKDPEAPTVNWVGGTSSGWVKEVTVTPHVNDPGLGVKAITLSPEGASPHTNSQGCAGANGSRCPGSWETSFGPSYFLEGERNASVTAYDPLGPDVSSHVSSSYQFTTRIDRQKPEVELEGEFTEALEEAEEEGEGAEAPALHLPVYNLRIDATDKANEGNPNAEPKARRSGVKNLSVFLDGKAMKVPWGAQGCLGPIYSCPMEKIYPVPMDEVQGAGVHKLKVIAEDQVGNKREREIEFEYFPATGMKDEYVMQHFSLPNGEGNESEEEHPIRPELAVNVTNGNLVYRQKDVEVSGPDVNLEVERFYNSQLPEEDNTEWGDGWTLAQTPQLEPEETKEEAPPAKASMVRTSGALQSTVNLPTESGATQFDKKLQAVVTNDPSGGYTVEDQSGESDTSLAFDESGKVTEMRTPGYAKVNYAYEGGELAEMAVEDPATASLPPGALEKTPSPPVYVDTVGSSGSGEGQFEYPEGVALGPEGDIYVSDAFTNRIERFDGAGEYVGQFGEYGSGDGQLNYPRGIATDSEGDVWVVDGSNRRVEEFSPGGEYLGQFGETGSGEGQFGKGVRYLAIDAAGDVWVVDTQHNRVEEFSPGGEYLGQFGETGSGNGQLEHPEGIAVDPGGDLWVIDNGNDRVEKFSASGEYLDQFGGYGSGEGQVDYPQDVVIDPEGNLWVTDGGNARVEEFSSEGRFVNQFGASGSGEGQFNEPTALASEPGGRLLIADPYNSRLQRWITSTAPLAATEAASTVGEASATLNATVNPHGLDTHYSFEYGITDNYGASVPASAEDVGSGAEGAEVSENVSGLKPWVIYHFRVVATNAEGTTYGEDETLTTWADWTLESPPNPTNADVSYLSDVACPSSTNCLAVGHSNANEGQAISESWGGESWSLHEGGADQRPTDLSCGTPTECWAVGTQGTTEEILVERHYYEGYEEEWYGGRYSKHKPITPEGATNMHLDAISCSGEWQCTAVGYYDDSEGHQDALIERLEPSPTYWAIQSAPALSGTVALEGVSCPSSTNCLAVGYRQPKKGEGPREAIAERWDGSEWSAVAVPTPTGEESNPHQLNDVSCASTSSCIAIGSYYGEHPIFASYDGSSISLTAPPLLKEGIFYPEGLSCDSATSCLAIGYENGVGTRALAYNGSEWAPQSVPTPEGKSAYLEGVSCSEALACAAVGKATGSGETVTLAERISTTWTLESPPNPTNADVSYLSDVACPSSTNCLAVGHSNANEGQAISESWGGESWSLHEGGADQRPTDLSCGTPTECWAVGTQGTTEEILVERHYYEGYEEEWYGGRYSKHKPITPEGATNMHLDAISCSGEWQCTAVGYYDDSEGHQDALIERLEPSPTYWAIQSAPALSGTVALEGVSCPSSTNCLAVGYRQPKKGEGPREAIAERWDGSEWSAVAVPTPTGEESNPHQLNDVSCASTSSCIAIGSYYGEHPIFASYDGSSISLTAPPLLKEGIFYPEGLSCDSATSCLAIGYENGVGTRALAYNGSEWAPQSVPTPEGKSAYLEGVSCSEALACAAVGKATGSGETVTLAERFEIHNQEAITKAATDVTHDTARLNATVNPHGLDTHYHFEYGPTRSYGTSIPFSPKDAGSGSSDIAVSEGIEGLEASRPYHYRLVATSEIGTTYGEDKTFTTTPPTFAFAVSEEGSGEGGLSDPFGVAADAEGNIYVADSGNDRIEKFSPSGKFLSQFGEEGSGNGQLSDPRNLAVGAEGSLFVADHANKRVEVFSPGGQYLSQFGEAGSEAGQFGKGPGGIAIDEQGDVLVSDSSHDRIEKFSPEGEYLDQFGEAGSGNGQLSSPQGLAIDAHGAVYVTDLGNDRIEKFSPEGAYLAQFGSQGSGEGELSLPWDVALDPSGSVWVTDAENDRIEGFSPAGSFIGQFGSQGSGDGQLNGPAGLAIDSAGDFLVADQYNNRVQKLFVAKATPEEEVELTEDDPKVEVDTSGGMVASVDAVEGIEAEPIETAYSHEGELLTSADGPKGETQYEYDSEERLTKVTLPNGTWGEVKYDEFGRVKSVTVSIEGKAKTTFFSYKEEPRRTTVSPEGQPITIYDIAPDGSVLKWWNKQEPPEIENLSGSLYANKETEKPVEPEAYELLVQAHSVEGIAKIEIVANGDQLVDEKTCEQDYEKEGTECTTVEDPWVTETQDWPPGILYLEVIVTDSVEGTETVPNTESTKFWVNIPYTPPPDPEAEEPPKFSEVLRFREEFGLDLDLQGNGLAIDERIFDLIGDWNNPHTPAGEVARATDGRWGSPLRSVDAAEMDYREGYVASIGKMLEEWGPAERASTYAGYSVNNAAGGIIEIGFTNEPATNLAAFEDAMDPPAQDRLVAYWAPQGISAAALVEKEGAVSEAIEASETLQSEVTEFWVEYEEDIVKVGASDTSQVSSLLTAALGSLNGIDVVYQPVHPEYSSGRNRTTGRMLAGDRILNKEGPIGCTAGFGAFEQRQQKSNGETIVVPFFLTSGHCYAVGIAVWRSPYAGTGGIDKWDRVGEVTRSAFEQGVGIIDAEAVRLESAGVAPRHIFGRNDNRPRFGEPVVARRGQELCFSGAYTSGVRCGKVVGIRKQLYNEGSRPAGSVQIAARNVAGDSGSPVWNPKTGAAVGILRARQGNYTWVQPLLNTPNNHGDVYVGALQAAKMYKLHIMTGG